jgi:ribonuclease HI
MNPNLHGISTSSSRGAIKFLQVNLNKQGPAHQTAFELALESFTDILLLQEPSCPRNYQLGGYIGLQHSAYHLVTPQPTASLSNIREKPRVLTYVRKASKLDFHPRYDLCNDPDLQIIEVIGPETFYIVNIYNERQRIEGSSQLWPTTITRRLLRLTLSQPALIAGDFNLHHFWWNSAADPTKAAKASRLVDWLTGNNASLLINADEINTKGGTLIRANLKAESIIDLAFYTSFKKLVWRNWRYIEGTGSDHESIAFEAAFISPTAPIGLPPSLPAYNTKKADWEAFTTELQAKESLLTVDIQGAVASKDFDLLATLLTEAITRAAESTIPRKRSCEYSKPWWDDLLKSLRQAKNTALRAYKRRKTSELNEAWKKARNTYFNAIRTAKETSWVEFLETRGPDNVFEALRYTKEKGLTKVPNILYEAAGARKEAKTFEEKCEAFLTTLLPPPPPLPPTAAPLTTAPPIIPTPYTPPNPARPGSKAKKEWEWPSLSEIEVKKAILTSSPKKAPGPDQINFAILHYAYKAIPTVFYTVYNALFQAGYHPTQWKESIGIILPKPNKGDYTVPKAYRIIALINCLSKALEKIFATRLGYLANITDLLHYTQLGGRKQRSAIDAALLLLNEIQGQKEARKFNSTTITSVLFLDIKGAFDCVSKPTLLLGLERLGLPGNLIGWVASFLSNRKIQLAFDGRIQPLTDIEVGLPQGSPISPILFLIYVRDIVAEKGFQVSYIDDFGIAVTSTVAKKNCAALRNIAECLFTKGAERAVQFDLGKTELIHFSSRKAPILEGLELGGITITPKPIIRWLGIWFDSKLSFKAHIEKKINSATAAFYSIQRLGNTQKGLNAKGLRLLYIACVTSISDFGVQLWWKGEKTPENLIKPFQRLQNLAAARITGAFKGSPHKALELEAGLLPPKIRFEKACNLYSLRTLLFQNSHPITQAVTTPVRDELGGEDSDTALRGLLQAAPKIQLRNLAVRVNTYMARNWNIEKAKPTWATPWAPTPRAEISISKSIKAAAKKEHTSLLKDIADNPFTESVIIYTDGSQGEDPTIGNKSLTNGAGACVLNSQGRLRKAISWNLGPNIEVADAETIGIFKALQLVRAIHPTPTTLYLFTDSQAAIQRVESGNSYYAFKIRDLLQALESLGYHVKIYWVPSHVGVFGNELADKLAKKALEKKPRRTDLVTTIGHLRRLIKARSPAEWEAYWDSQAEKQSRSLGTHYQRVCQGNLNFRAKLYTISLPRKFQSAYTQLKLGIGYLKAYQRLIGHEENDTCRKCSSGKETTAHLILYCKGYAAERLGMRRALNRLPLSLQTLFCTKVGREALEAYLTTTQICTAKWLEEP